MHLKVFYKKKPIGEIYTCKDNQWGSYHYETDYGIEGLANTTLVSALEDLIDFEINENDLKDFKLKLISLTES